MFTNKGKNFSGDGYVQIWFFNYDLEELVFRGECHLNVAIDESCNPLFKITDKISGKRIFLFRNDRAITFQCNLQRKQDKYELLVTREGKSSRVLLSFKDVVEKTRFAIVFETIFYANIKDCVIAVSEQNAYQPGVNQNPAIEQEGFQQLRLFGGLSNDPEQQTFQIGPEHNPALQDSSLLAPVSYDPEQQTFLNETEQNSNTEGEEDMPLETFMFELSLAIRRGDEATACRLVKIFAQLKANMKILPLYNSQEKSSEDIITIEVNVMDKVSSNGYFSLTVNPHFTTILMLKMMTFRKFHFPPQVQRWIIGKRLPKDDELLVSLGVTLPGTMLYLYLSTAKETGIRMKEGEDPFEIETSSKEAASSEEKQPHDGKNSAAVLQPCTNDQLEQNQPSSTASFSSLKEENLPERESKATEEQNQPSSTASFSSLKEENLPERESKATEDTEDEVLMRGWSCSACTLRNIPTRPGCLACGTRRPENYVVPEDCFVPPQEVERMQQEEILDVLAIESFKDEE